VRADELSIHSHKLPDPDTLREQNDSNPDPTYQDCWPSERYKSDGPDDGVLDGLRARIAKREAEQRAFLDHCGCFDLDEVESLYDLWQPRVEQAEAEALRVQHAAAFISVEKEQAEDERDAAWELVEDLDPHHLKRNKMGMRQPREGGEDGLARAVSTTASSACRTDQCAQLPSMHANFPDRLSTVRDDNPCESTTQLCDSVINAASEHVESCVSEGSHEHPAWVCIDCGHLYGGENLGATWHIGRCDICGETLTVTEPRDFAGYHDVSCGPAISCDRKLDNLHHEPSLLTVESCPECGTVTDIEYPADADAADTFDVPFPVQSWTFEALIESEVDHLHEIIDDHHDEIVKMARERHRSGYVEYGSAAYRWDAKTRLTNVLEELADSGGYLTTGPVE
jgi:rRNA maturation protein Nop10